MADDHDVQRVAATAADLAEVFDQLAERITRARRTCSAAGRQALDEASGALAILRRELLPLVEATSAAFVREHSGKAS